MNVKIRRDECDDEKVDESNEWRMRGMNGRSEEVDRRMRRINGRMRKWEDQRKRVSYCRMRRDEWDE
jgi:hypothetical protein